MGIASPAVVTATIVLLYGFVALSAIDGVYLHLIRYRLYAHPETRTEHWLHSGRALLFIPSLLTIFSDVGGPMLWIGVGVLGIDQLLELLDTLVERWSRASLGGLSSGEYALHIAISTLRAGAIALAVASRPRTAWNISNAELSTLSDLAPLRAASALLVPGAIAAAVLHLGLAVAAKRRLQAPPSVAAHS
ncbi:Hypothetical protein A7982_07892 [Minicystis rosea]|nr:Hypothetical protein A7982_07892 [Minicystis rosea]